jgi:putative transposase
MTDNLFKNKYRISSSRLQGWDYSCNGYYFVTLCIKNREYIFGEIENGVMFLSDLGKTAEQCWRDIPDHFPFAKPDSYVIMPNHMHGIVIIDKKGISNVDGTPNKFGPQSKNLGSIIRGFKIGVKKQASINGFHFDWQSRFHDRIIRDENELWNIRNYIQNNPQKWNEDEENPERV